MSANVESIAEVGDPVSTTNGYGPDLPTHTPTVTSFEPETEVIVIGTLTSCGSAGVALLHVELPATGGVAGLELQLARAKLELITAMVPTTCTNRGRRLRHDHNRLGDNVSPLPFVSI